MNRKLRMGMVGGGRGAFIGQVHRMAANLDGKIELVAGAFSSDPEKSKLSGQDFFIDPNRAYGSYEEMAKAEAAREDGIDFVSIVVQNHLHFSVAKCFLDAGINVICDKPLTVDLQQAKELKKIVEDSGLIFALTHNYTGYPMVEEARRMIKDGELGRLLKIVTEYPQGYAVGDVEGEGSGAIANWRADPKIAGKSNCMGDIGTHAHNLTKYITGLEIDELAAEGISCDLVDPRTTSPLDENAILESVEATGRLVVVDEAPPRCGLTADIAGLAADRAFSSLKGPIKQVCAPHSPTPFSPELEAAYLPDIPKIKAAIKATMA